MVASSSGESEYYAIVKTGSQCLGSQALLSDFGLSSRFMLVTDATAAQGIAARRGLGRIGHIEVNQLWLQDKVNRGDIVVEKTRGRSNFADTLTKHVLGESLRVHVHGARLTLRLGRHELVPVVDESVNAHALSKDSGLAAQTRDGFELPDDNPVQERRG